MNRGVFGSAAAMSALVLVGSIIRTSIENLRRISGLFVLSFAVTMLLAACGDGGDDSPSSSAPGGGNSAPTISGNPPSQISVDAPFSFTPTANDADGDTLSFSATNLPSWASIDSGTGTITGTPGAVDVGTYSGIRITVSDGTASTTSSAFAVDVVAVASGSALLSWTPPTENTDGSPLTNLDGYRVYWGPASGNYTNSVSVDKGLASYLVEGLTPGTWYFAATAVNESAIESTFSNEASKTIL